jgi:hypothetical protein
MATRRLLVSKPPDTRQLYKHLVLIAKIVLVADGRPSDAADDVMATFREHHPRARCAPPTLGQLIDAPDDPRVTYKVIEAVGCLLAYVDQLGETRTYQR